MTVLFPKRRKTNRFTLIQFNIGCEGLEIKGDWHPQTVQWKRCPIKIRPFSGVSMISICGFKKSVMYNRPMRLSAGCTEQPHHCPGVGSSLSSVFMHTTEQCFSCTCFKYHLGKNIVFYPLFRIIFIIRFQNRISDSYTGEERLKHKQECEIKDYGLRGTCQNPRLQTC